MSHTLTLYLAILGGVVLATVIAHNAWTTRKLVRLQPRRVAVEPLDGDNLDTIPADTQPFVDDHEPTQPMSLDGEDLSVPPLKRSPSPLDALVDAIASIAIDAPMSGDHLLVHLPASRRAGSKSLMVEALRSDCGEWEPPQAGVLYSALQAGVLMANRMGALNEIEYSEFVQKVQNMVDLLGGAVEFPDMLDVVARARELDAFASAHDAQLAMRLHAQGSAWSVGYVHQQASRQGLIPGALPGRLVLPSPQEGAPPILTLQYDAQLALADDPEQSAVREVVLAFDVPQTGVEHAPFMAWCASGEALSHGLQASMADDQGHPFTAAAFASIEGELTRLYEALSQRDLAAGAPTTRRLFS